MNRTGSDGVAPETSSMTPAAAVRIAAVHGANANAAGRRSLRNCIQPRRSVSAWTLYSRFVRTEGVKRLFRCANAGAKVPTLSPSRFHLLMSVADRHG